MLNMGQILSKHNANIAKYGDQPKIFFGEKRQGGGWQLNDKDLSVVSK